MSASRLVWYASYGSNCNRDRFLVYLRGGGIPGTERRQQGARDPRDPMGDAPTSFPSAVRFTGRSLTWGGAPALLEHRPVTRGTGALGRRYLITEEQFSDVMAQESGRPIEPLALPDLTELAPGERVVLGEGRYDALVALTPVDGVPCVTFTSPQPPEDRAPAAPSASYLGTILRGLREVHPLTAVDLAERISEAAGIHPEWDRAAILDLLG